MPLSKMPIEREYIVNSLRTIRQTIRITYQSLGIAKRIVERNVGQAALQKEIASSLKDSPNSKDVLVRLKASGGASKLMEGILTFLRPRYDQYSNSIATAELYCSSKKNVSLAEMALAVEVTLPAGGNVQPSTTIAFSVCWNVFSCLVVAAVIIATLVITEGEANGDDGSGPGDFPDPDPDGGQPA